MLPLFLFIVVLSIAIHGKNKIVLISLRWCVWEVTCERSCVVCAYLHLVVECWWVNCYLSFRLISPCFRLNDDNINRKSVVVHSLNRGLLSATLRYVRWLFLARARSVIVSRGRSNAQNALQLADTAFKNTHHSWLLTAPLPVLLRSVISCLSTWRWCCKNATIKIFDSVTCKNLYN